MGFEKQKKLLNYELEQFNSILSEILPRYLDLMRKKDISADEKKELGDIEHYLIEVNSKIADIKSRLDQDLFGERMNHYYEAKKEAMNGDPDAKQRLDDLRKGFLDSIDNEDFFNWN